jgi:hypothetical protein
MRPLVAYYGVSTARQGRSGLRLDATRCRASLRWCEGFDIARKEWGFLRPGGPRYREVPAMEATCLALASSTAWSSFLIPITAQVLRA